MINSDLINAAKNVIMSPGIQIIVIFVLFYIIGRLQKIERYINFPQYIEKGAGELRPISYQARINVTIEWDKIIRWCFPEFKTDDEAWEFAMGLYKDPELKLVKDGGLFGRDFGFVEFYDGFSGLNPIWSDYQKRFLDDLEIRRYLFENGEGYSKNILIEFSENPISRPMVISPEFIGFRSILPDGDMGEKDKISQIPYYEIIYFFAEVEKNSSITWGGNSMVKKFPKWLQDKFDKYQVEYDTLFYEDYGCGCEPSTEIVKTKWLENKGIELYRQRMQSHLFKTPYYSISISLKFFNS